DMSGAEIMDAIEEATLGWWRPSPGSLYPILKELTKDGYIEYIENKNRKIYRLTERGKEALVGFNFYVPGNFKPYTYSVEEVLSEMESYVEYLADKSNELKSNEEYKKRIQNIIEQLKMLLEQL
ncbi:MAG: PadR family transcriptional regulator, partial [Sulfolobus sp.]|nr:PadR family transcriptional regulator [Sulfolobus sp.]